MTVGLFERYNDPVSIGNIIAHMKARISELERTTSSGTSMAILAERVTALEDAIAGGVGGGADEALLWMDEI